MSGKRNLYRLLIAGVAFLGMMSIMIVCLIKYMPTSKTMSAEEYFGSLTENESFVIVDDHMAQERALILDGSIYIDYTLVQRELNDRFYWDASVGEVLYTTSDETLEIPINSTEYYAGGETFDAGYEILKTTSSGMFFSANFLQQFSDLTCTLYDAPSRVVIRFGSRMETVATLKRDSAVRYLGGIKSPIITKVTEDSSVYVIEEMEHWTKICTKDGYIGYVSNKALKKITERLNVTYYTEPEREWNSLDEKVNMVWYQVDVPEDNYYFDEKMEGVTGINVISPTWYSLADNEGNVTSLIDWDFMEKAHERDLKVWALVSNFNSDISTTTILSSKEARNRIQQYLVQQALEVGFDGINIDFESIAQEAGYSYVQFMRELSVLCRKNGIALSVDVPVPMEFSSYYNRAELGRVCDYVIMMGYDEHYYGSEKAGSVASMKFEENGLINMLKEVPAQKVISGIPFYSRVWYTATAENGEKTVTSELITMQGAQSLLEELQISTVYDDATGQNYASWTDEEGRTCELWLEDLFSVEKRVALVQQYAVGGIAQWVLGDQIDDVWEIIKGGLAH